MSNERPPEPWHSFLRELDQRLREPIEIHCLGGFVVTMLYGLERFTADLDYLEVRPKNQAARLQELAGEGSPLHRMHKVHVQSVTVAPLPESYAERLREMFPEAYTRIQLFGLDPYDLALSKLERNTPLDRQDVKHLARTVPLDPKILRERYEKEMRPMLARPDREDLTLSLWIEEYFPPS